ncbi:hypothetical protein VB780_13765 [Leptolyngbya sp. CCNP1308]|uniref:hypothetical protein n=1 Tax=Leptolyngbya sp. CCNP1308 TaxID=3110255 RepID=UPI002B2157F5|nr:hypothetical protein [Leptolyngbya sp. CCNP1308]MEA5449647.1 hypothetical protein [Leptolyngbya sp. CCNP1308]
MAIAAAVAIACPLASAQRCKSPATVSGSVIVIRLGISSVMKIRLNTTPDHLKSSYALQACFKAYLNTL